VPTWTKPVTLVGNTNENVNDLNAILDDIYARANGGLDETNVPNLAAAFTSYKLLWSGAADVSAGAGSYMLGSSAPSNVSSAVAGAARHVFYLDPAIFTANTRTTKYFLRASLISNNVVPGFTSPTVSLSTVGGFGGAAGGLPTIGTVAGVAIVNLTVPGAASFSTATSGDITAPVAGQFAVIATFSGTQTTGSWVVFNAQLYMRQV
jgi:hypothetical protein